MTKSKFISNLFLVLSIQFFQPYTVNLHAETGDSLLGERRSAQGKGAEGMGTVLGVGLGGTVFLVGLTESAKVDKEFNRKLRGAQNHFNQSVKYALTKEQIRQRIAYWKDDTINWRSELPRLGFPDRGAEIEILEDMLKNRKALNLNQQRKIVQAAKEALEKRVVDITKGMKDSQAGTRLVMGIGGAIAVITIASTAFGAKQKYEVYKATEIEPIPANAMETEFIKQVLQDKNEGTSHRQQNHLSVGTH